MNTTRLFGSVTIACGLLWGALGCASTEVSSNSKTAVTHETTPRTKFVHAVFFTLKPETSQAEIDSLIGDAYELLAKVPTVRHIHSGRRDERMTGDKNDKEFVVGLLVAFDDKEGQDAYIEHPLHKQYVEKHKDHFANVRVFDFNAK